MTDPVAATPLGDLLKQRHALSTDQLLVSLLPLFRQVQETHSLDRVAPLEGIDALLVHGHRVFFESSAARQPRFASSRIEELERAQPATLKIVGQQSHTMDVDAGAHESTDLLLSTDGAVNGPVFLPGYRSWEHAVGHHDALTDHFTLGLILASMACGLDFHDADQLKRFLRHRRNLFEINGDLNPVIARQIVRLTELDRHARAQDLPSTIQALEHWRDQDLGLDLDLKRIEGFQTASTGSRRQTLLGRMRERLFDVSRRNRLLYFRPTLRSLNLTFASVPLRLDAKAITPQQLFTWQPEIEKLLAEETPIPLGRYVRFEDASYLPSVLDKIIAESRRDVAEFGFSQLRLVICFLRWHNLKDNPDERIDSPLLLLPVQLTKKKGVRDAYVLTATSREAEVSPVLRHHLKQLYDLDLPRSVDLADTTVRTFHEVLLKQIQASEPGVTLTLVDRPQVELVHAKARRRLEQYGRRLRVLHGGLKDFRQLEHSYGRDDFQPLGIKLFLDLVRPAKSSLLRAPGMRPLQEARFSAGAERSSESVAFREGTGDVNPYSWDFDLCSVTVANFNYRKMSLVRDYDKLVAEELESPVFDAVFPIGPRPAPPPEAPADLATRHPVVLWDPTQLRAVTAAADGRSYVVQGPPGTGKSQTITNLLADLVAQGKRVLFVCEKRAALDVVYFRLKKAGLERLACLVHDSQSDKRDFIMDLKATYEGLLADAARSLVARRKRRALLSEIQARSQRFESFEAAMRAQPEFAGARLRDLMNRLAEIGVPKSPGSRGDLPAYKTWSENNHALADLERALRAATPDGVLAGHPLSGLDPRIVSEHEPRAFVQANLQRAKARLDALSQSGSPLVTESDSLGDLKALVSLAEDSETLMKRGLLALVDPESPASQALETEVRAMRERRASAEKARAANDGWHTKLDARETDIALQRARAFSQSPMRFFSPSFWQLRRTVAERYDFARHAVRPGMVDVLESLKAEHGSQETVASAESAFSGRYGGPEPEVSAIVERCRSKLDAFLERLPDERRRTLRDRSRPEIAKSLLGLARDSQGLLEAASAILRNPARLNLGELRRSISTIGPALDQLHDFEPCLRALDSLPGELTDAIMSSSASLHCLEAAIAEQTLDRALRSVEGISGLDGTTRETHSSRLAALHTEWLRVNAAVVLEANQRRFVGRVALSSRPASVLSPADEAFKKRYASGRKELEHEFGKTVRYKSVRSLIAGTAGEVILDLKPIWLMSPLSVSDTLPLEKDVFDVVVFDEASQIPLEEAVPSLFRARQIVVSGDQMQLPPTNFFATAQVPDEDELVEPRGEDDLAPEMEGNGFLNQAARSLPSYVLGWHYRSRSESLISFSNAAFYENRLLTVPERRVLGGTGGEIRVSSADQAAAHSAMLLNRPVSFHFLENARYELRRNNAEAEYISGLVRGLLTLPAPPTIGIIAFSEAQQQNIEDAMERLRLQDPAFGARLDEEADREEDGQFAGLLVKNLENIQGDERDVILLSVCYGRAPDGRFLMNFGPINQAGGEKRLNVAFSRAKRHMAIVTSIRFVDVRNTYNDGANTLRCYLQYAEAMSTGDLASADAVLRTVSLNKRGETVSRRPDAVVRAMSGALRARGFLVEESLGHSSFRCDMAVRKPGDDAHRLAIFVDSRDRNDGVLEREVLKPGVLRSFDWRVHDVLSKDWYLNPEEVLAGLERSIENVVPRVETEVDVDALLASWVDSDDDDEAEDEDAHEPPGNTAPRARNPAPGERTVRRFELVNEISRKFWEVGVSGPELLVRFGRLDTEGQTKRKDLGSEDAARREAEKLVREKIGKGYREIR